MILYFLREGVGLPRKLAYPHPHAQIHSLNERGVDEFSIGSAGDHLGDGLDMVLLPRYEYLNYSCEIGTRAESGLNGVPRFLAEPRDETGKRDWGDRERLG